MQRLLQVWLLLSVLSGQVDTQAAPPDKHHEVQISPGHTLKLWFKPKYGWRAKSYDQRYPGCTRQQEHRVYTADGVSMPDLLKNPNNLHWLSDPEEAGGKALYIGHLGLSGGMPPSKRVMGRAKKDLSAIAVQATEQGKMDALRRELAQAEENADFDGVYEKVFDERSSEQADLAIFDLTVGEVRELSNYSEFFAVGGLGGQDEEKARDAEDEDSVLGPADLVEGLYAPVQSHQHQTACKLLKSKKYEPAYSKVLPLTAGLLYKKYTDGEDAEAYGLHVFWHHVLSDPRELVGIHQVALNMRCMEACDADDKGVLAKLHKPILNDITSWVLAAFEVKSEAYRDFQSRRTITCTVPLLPVLEGLWGACPYVLAYGPLVEGVLDTLRNWKKNPQVSQEEALGTLGTLVSLLGAAWPSDLRQAILDYVLISCKRGSEDLNRVAIAGLSKALETQCSDQARKAILEALTGVCKGSDRDLCQAALSKALEEGCSEEDWKAIVRTLTNLCKEDTEWTYSAVGGLEELEQAYPEEVWDARIEVLTGLCKDDSIHVRYAAAGACSKALETQCSEQARKAIVEALTHLCKDDSEWVRSAAPGGLSKALETQCSEQAREAIVQTLISLCRDGNYSVRLAAAGGLSKALETQYSDEGSKGIVQVLTHLCKDGSEWVRSAAAGSLSKALEGACSQEAWHAIVQTLISLCKDENFSVRLAAGGGLSKALETQYSDEGSKGIVQVLTHLCKDDSEWVRLEAAGGLSEALKIPCSDEAWNAILETLKNLCKDEERKVREAADQALARAMDQQDLLVRVLMDSELFSPTLTQIIATYNPCLTLPAKFDSKVSEHIEQAFAQERHKRGWPKALLGVRDLPPMASLSKQAGNKTDAPSKEVKSMSK